MLSAYSLSSLGVFGANATGANPGASTLVAGAGENLYGTASAGGTYGAGTVFEVANGSTAITNIASFNGADGAEPEGGLTLDAFGNLYGTTYAGGANNDGTVFEISSGSNTISTLASFNGANGQQPQCSVALDASGNLFGTTWSGGASNAGTVFEIAKGSDTITTLAAFNVQNGQSPAGKLAVDGSGNLYGTTYEGGASREGTVFEVASGSTSITTRASFTGTNGDYPWSGITMDGAGNLYGTTSVSVFEIANGSSAVTTIGGSNSFGGSFSEGELTMDAGGNLFGTIYSGGADKDGSVFEFAKGSTALTTLASLDGTNGMYIGAGVAVGAAGNVYGTSGEGGTYNDGTIFEIASGSRAVTSFICFDENQGSPIGGVALDASGDVYGTSGFGGTSNDGTVFEIAAGSNAATTLASFDGADGSDPSSGLTVDASGNLYGTTRGGGEVNSGTVFEIAHSSNTITTLASFLGYSGAAAVPMGALTFDAAGNLYGTSTAGGTNPSGGAIFELAGGSHTITTLATFNNVNGWFPESGVRLDASGNLFGTTVSGGANGGGTVFEVAKGTTAITDIASFNAATGEFLYGITLDSTGDLYGTTESGGADGDGTVFEIAKGSSTITTVATFNGVNGANPSATLTLGAAGNLYGTTQNGGAYNDGTVFEIPNSSSGIVTLLSFDGTNGSNVQAGLTPDGFGNFYGATTTGGLIGSGTVFRLGANTTAALALADGSNPSNFSQAITFTASIGGGLPDGETVRLIDASNNNAVVATGTLSGGSATLTVPAGTLVAGTHKLIAGYGGDANFAASESVPYTQTVQVAVTNVQVNGNLPSLVGAQRSMVDSILYTFSEAVNISGDAATLAIHSGQTGTLPTSLAWTAIDPNADGSSIQWAVTFSGNGVTGNSIADGVYDISLNTTDLTSDADPSASVQSRPTDTFYRLFGDINGDGVVNAADNFQFKTALATYNAAFDYNDDGVVNAADNFQFKVSQSYNFGSSGIVYTI